MKQLLLTFLLLPVLLFAQEPEAIREPAVPYDFEVAVPEEKVPTYPYNRGLRLFSENGKLGYHDALGKVVIPASFKTLPPFNPAGYVQVAKENLRGQQGIIDTSGRYLVPPRYDRILYLSPNQIAAVRNDSTYIYDLTTESVTAVIPQAMSYSGYADTVLTNKISLSDTEWWGANGQKATSFLPVLLRHINLSRPDELPAGLTVKGRFYGTQTFTTVFPQGMSRSGFHKNYQYRNLEFYVVEWQGRLHLIRYPNINTYRHYHLPGSFALPPDADGAYDFNMVSHQGYFSRRKKLWHSPETQRVSLRLPPDSLLADYYFPLIEIATGDTTYQRITVRAEAIRWPDLREPLVHQHAPGPDRTTYLSERKGRFCVEDVYGKKLTPADYRTVKAIKIDKADAYLAELPNGKLVFHDQYGMRSPPDFLPGKQLKDADGMLLPYREVSSYQQNKYLIDKKGQSVFPLDKTYERLDVMENGRFAFMINEGTTSLIRLRSGKVLRTVAGEVFVRDKTRDGFYKQRLSRPERMGLVDDRLRTVLPPDYLVLEDFSLGGKNYLLAGLRKAPDDPYNRMEYGLLTPDGSPTDIRFTGYPRKISEDLFYTTGNARIVLYGSDGRRVGEPEYLRMQFYGPERKSPYKAIHPYGVVVDHKKGRTLVDSTGQVLLKDHVRIEIAPSGYAVARKARGDHIFVYAIGKRKKMAERIVAAVATYHQSENWSDLMGDFRFREVAPGPDDIALFFLLPDGTLNIITNDNRLLPIADLLISKPEEQPGYGRLIERITYWSGVSW